MVGRMLVVSGAAVFALGVIGLGALFDEPGGDARQRRPAQAAAADPQWGAWEPAALDPMPATVGLPAAPPRAEEEEVLVDDAAPLPHVWATPAEWSEVD